jgi:hypothetical protein
LHYLLLKGVGEVASKRRKADPGAALRQIKEKKRKRERKRVQLCKKNSLKRRGRQQQSRI